jgi:hypothetical protein
MSTVGENILDHGGDQRGADRVGGAAGGGVVIAPLARYGRCASCGAWERRDALHGASIRIHHGMHPDEIVTVRWCPDCYARESEGLRALAWDRTLVLGAQLVAHAPWAAEVGVAHDAAALEDPAVQAALAALRSARYRGRNAIVALAEGDDTEAALRARGVAMPVPVEMVRGAFARCGDEDDGEID